MSEEDKRFDDNTEGWHWPDELAKLFRALTVLVKVSVKLVEDKAGVDTKGRTRR